MKGMIQWAVTSSALILIVLAARFFFKDRLSARLRYALWAIVLVRLLVPLQIPLPSPVSDALPLVASNLARPFEERLDAENQRLSVNYIAMIPSELVTWENVPKRDGVYLQLPLPYDHAPLPEHMPVNEEDVIYRTVGVGDHNMDRRLMSLWTAGVGVAVGVMLLSNLRFAHRLKKRRRLLEYDNSPLSVYAAEGLPSPCLFGVFRPTVYVTPEAAENPEVLRHVLAHELTHYAHKDHIWSLLRCLALALHWYNPLVWLAVALSKGDGELACDEGAVARLGEEERIPYGRTLVDMVAQRSLRPADLLSCSTAMTGGKKSIQQRVALLVKKPETVKTALFGAAAVIVLAAVFVFSGRGQPSPETFQDILDRAASICYIPSPISSTFYPDAITDSDLLDAARERLSTFEPLEANDPQLEVGTLIHSPRITLTSESGENVYTLLWQNNYTYLLPGDTWDDYYALKKEENTQLISTGGILRSQPNDNVISAIERLARQQSYRIKEDLTPATYDYNRYHNLLNAAQGIYRSGTMLHNGQSITDPALLAQARELLTLERIPRDGPLEWDGAGEDWLGSLVISTQAPGPDWSFDEWMENGNVFSIVVPEEDTTAYICSGSNGTGGYYLGTVSYENLSALYDLFDQQDQHTASTFYNDFLDRAEGAVSIQVQTGSVDSTKQLSITDPEYLELARTALLTAGPPDVPSVNGPLFRSEANLRYEAAGQIYAVTLTPAEGGSVTYYVDNDNILLPLGDFSSEDDREPWCFGYAGRLHGEASYALWVYANVGVGRFDPPTGYAVPDLSGLTVHR